MDRYLALLSPLFWPLATLIIALLFRNDLSKALGRMGQFKYRDLEMTFRDDLRQAEQLARAIPPPAPKEAVVLEVAHDEARELGGRLIVSPTCSEAPAGSASPAIEPAGRPPRESIESAWSVVTRALNKATSAEGDRRASGLTNPDVAARFLVDRGRLGGPEALLVGLLRTLRDRSNRLDQPPPSAEDARRFADLAHRVASRIEELA